MDTIKSSINPILTLDYILTADENKWFDRKSAKLRVADIASIVIGVDVWNNLDDMEHQILVYMSGKKQVTVYKH